MTAVTNAPAPHGGAFAAPLAPTAHVLVVGTGQGFPRLIREVAPGTRTTVLCRLELTAYVADAGANARILGVPAAAPDRDWIALATAVHELEPVTGVVAFGELDQDRAAIIAAALGVAGHDPQTVAWVHDKRAMRVRLRTAGVDDTPAAFVADVEQLRAFVAEHGLPCIVKPVQGAGSAGIAVLRAGDDVERAFALASARFDGVPDAGVIVERFHAGPQYSVEALSEGGEHALLAITRKFSDPETLVELGHVVPASDLDARDARACAQLAVRVLDALGVRSGPTHTELVLTADGPRVIETHVRLAGDEIPALVHGATGIDVRACVARQAAGARVLPEVRAALAAAAASGRHEAIWFALPPAGGTLVELRGIDSDDPALTVTPLLDPGDEVVTPANSDSRVGYARASAATAQEAVRRAREAAERVTAVIAVAPLSPTAPA